MNSKYNNLIFVVLLLTNFLDQILGEKENPRKLQALNDNYINITVDYPTFQTDTCWYTQIEDKISKVSINNEEVDNYKRSFEITGGGNVQIYFNSKLNDLSYFLYFNEELEKENIPKHCKINEHFKSHIVEMDLSHFDGLDVTTTANMFKGYSSLRRIILFHSNQNKLLSTNGMFNGCRNLKEIDFSYFSFYFVIDMGYMFSGCSSLEFFDFETFDPPQ